MNAKDLTLEEMFELERKHTCFIGHKPKQNKHMKTHAINEMKTHASAVYQRVPGDKRRPVKMIRPTLRQFAVTLRKIERGVRNAKRALRSKDQAVQFSGRELMAALYGERARIETYFRALGNS